MAGGALMAAIGIAYLLCEDYVLADFNPPCKSLSVELALSRSVAGIQIGLVFLSMWVTRSSALSLQAKQGLPHGNLVVGWAVLSTLHASLNAAYLVLTHVKKSCRFLRLWHTAYSLVATTCTASWSSS